MKTRRCPSCRAILRPSDAGCGSCGIDVPGQSAREYDRLAQDVPTYEPDYSGQFGAHPWRFDATMKEAS